MAGKIGKVVLITGASSGIGKATAVQLLNDGETVYGAARRVERMADLETKGMHVLRMDVTDDETMIDGVDRIIVEQGRIDVLINNAGYGSYGAVEDVPLDEARRQFDVNIFGLARLTQLVLPHMRGQRAGTIVNIGSIAGKIYTPLGAWYHATKHALEGFTDCLRFETAPFGIDVVLIEPGGIKTEWDEIAIDSLLETSGSGAYAALATKTAKMMRGEYEDPKISDPSVVAATIVDALGATKPKTRYPTGRHAKLYLFFRRLLSDRRFDKTLMSRLEKA